MNIWLALRNPLRHSPFRNHWVWSKKVTQHKVWEVQVSQYAYNFLELQANLAWWGEDHAGPRITINILGLTLDICVYDTRSWDDVTNSWKSH
jgi:hypothetical protein